MFSVIFVKFRVFYVDDEAVGLVSVVISRYGRVWGLQGGINLTPGRGLQCGR